MSTNSRRARASAAVLVAAALFARSGASRAQGKAPAKRGEVSAAFGKGVTIETPDGDLELNVRARVQLQGFVETKAPEAGGQRPAPDASFLVRRMRLLLQGHVLRRSVRYYVQLGLSARDMEPDLLVPVRDAFVEWLEVRDLSVRAGQMKVPYNRERLTSSSALELVDRSNANAEMNLDRDVGVVLFSRDLLGTGRLRYSGGVFGGDGRNRTRGGAGLLWAARVEAQPFGDFDDYVGADLEHTEKPKLSIGFAAAYNQDTARSQSTLADSFTSGDVDYKHAVADMLVKWKGFSLHGEVLQRKADTLVVGTTVGADGRRVVERPRSALAYMLQVGAPLAKGWDLAFRYGEVRPLDGDVVLRDREIGGGIGWFVRGHDLKLQLDYFRLVRDTREASDVETDRVRLQTQLFF